MGTRIFRVDVEEGARDFQASALEPGLPMLDRAGANYLMLTRWVGDVVAEPEWSGEGAVNFYVHPEDRGRLDNIVCLPCTKADLEGKFKDDVDAIQQRLKKVNAESSTEQLFYKIVRQSFTNLTHDLEQSDFDSHFFKYREPNQPWRLVWCWGYQRSDLQPAKGNICTTPECKLLFVKRPKDKQRCPDCQQVPSKRVARGGGISLRETILALLLLLLLGGFLFAWLGRPKLVAFPGEFKGAPGSHVEFRIEDHRWFFFKNDVTDSIRTTSDNPAIAEVGATRGSATARALGNTFLSFRFDRRDVDVSFEVAAMPPNSIRFEPKEAKLGLGTTVRVKIIGVYDNDVTADLTEAVKFVPVDSKIVFTKRKPYWEGAAVGKTKINATYQIGAKGKVFKAAMDVEVADIEFDELKMDLENTELAIGQESKMNHVVLDKSGTEYLVLASSKLDMNVEPPLIGTIEDDFVVGQKTGDAILKGRFDSTFKGESNLLEGHVSFKVGDTVYGDDGDFVVRPESIVMAVGAYRQINVISPSDEIIVLSCDNRKVIEVIGNAAVVGLASGSANVTVTQGDNSQVVNITVTGDSVKLVRFATPDITLGVGETHQMRIEGLTEEGEIVNVNPYNITWEKQPLSNVAALNRSTLEITALAATARHGLVAVYDGRLTVEGSLEIVAGGGSVALANMFLVYPPIPAHGYISTDYLGDRSLRFRDGRLLVGDVGENSILYGSLPSGTEIYGYDDVVFAGMSPDAINRYLIDHPPNENSVLRFYGDDGDIGSVTLRRQIDFTAGVPVIFSGATSSNASESDFNAMLDIKVLEAGVYRILSTDGTQLSESKVVGARSAVSFVTDKMDRIPGDEYDFVVERKMVDATKLFKFTFKLDARE